MVLLITREMEETRVQVRSTSAKYLVDKKEVAKRRQWLRQEADEWQSKAELALTKGRDDLARAAEFTVMVTIFTTTSCALTLAAYAIAYFVLDGSGAA